MTKVDALICEHQHYVCIIAPIFIFKLYMTLPYFSFKVLLVEGDGKVIKMPLEVTPTDQPVASEYSQLYD